MNYHPSVTINDFTYRGALTYKDLSNAVCAAFDLEEANCHYSHEWLNREEFEEDKPIKNAEYATIFVVLVIVAVASCALTCIVTYTQKKRSKLFI